MSEYTIEIRELINANYPFALHDYPIFNEEYRDYLNSKILSHFYFREIGAETPDRFNFYLRTKMHEIMPYYNQLYKSELLKFNPFITDDYTTDTVINTESTNKNTSFSNGASGERVNEVYEAKSRDKSDENGTSKTTNKGTATGENTSTRTDNLKEHTLQNQLTTNDLSENSTNNQTTTNDLTDTTKRDTKRIDDLKTDTTGKEHSTTTATETKTNTYSDNPQTKNSFTRTIDPVSGVITEVGTDFSTTKTSETSNSNSNTDSANEAHTTNTGSQSTEENGTVTNKGTITVDGKGNTTNTGTIKVDTDTTRTNTGTVENAGNTTNTTADKSNNKTKYQRENNSVENAEMSSQRGTSTTATSEQNTSSNENTKNSLNFFGRRGYMPADLLKSFRETFLNIDMMIINELNSLFMGVYN